MLCNSPKFNSLCHVSGYNCVVFTKFCVNLFCGWYFRRVMKVINGTKVVKCSFALFFSYFGCLSSIRSPVCVCVCVYVFVCLNAKSVCFITVQFFKLSQAWGTTISVFGFYDKHQQIYARFVTDIRSVEVMEKVW